MANPILFLFLDLGIVRPDASRVQVSCDDGEVVSRMWTIHSQGHAGEALGCLESNGLYLACAKMRRNVTFLGATFPRFCCFLCIQSRRAARIWSGQQTPFLWREYSYRKMS